MTIGRKTVKSVERMTVHELMGKMEDRRIVWPPLETERGACKVPWRKQRIATLFDSLLRGYPLEAVTLARVRGHQSKPMRQWD